MSDRELLNQLLESVDEVVQAWSDGSDVDGLIADLAMEEADVRAELRKRDNDRA